MSKAKITKVGISLALVLALALGCVVFYHAAFKEAGSVTQEAAVREEGVPADGIVYIEPELVSLADTLSGSADSQAAAKAAFDIVNAKRQEAGLNALSWNAKRLLLNLLSAVILPLSPSKSKTLARVMLVQVSTSSPGVFFLVQVI